MATIALSSQKLTFCVATPSGNFHIHIRVFWIQTIQSKYCKYCTISVVAGAQITCPKIKMKGIFCQVSGAHVCVSKQSAPKLFKADPWNGIIFAQDRVSVCSWQKIYTTGQGKFDYSKWLKYLSLQHSITMTMGIISVWYSWLIILGPEVETVTRLWSKCFPILTQQSPMCTWQPSWLLDFGTNPLGKVMDSTHNLPTNKIKERSCSMSWMDYRNLNLVQGMIHHDQFTLSICNFHFDVSIEFCLF